MDFESETETMMVKMPKTAEKIPDVLEKITKGRNLAEKSKNGHFEIFQKNQANQIN